MGSMEDNSKPLSFNGQLYNALIAEDDRKVILLSQAAPEKAFRILTIHNDTILHMAAYSKQSDLLLKLLKRLPHDDLRHKLTRQNHLGNTILHEAATSSQLFMAADWVLQKAPAVLDIRNHLGESALFQAARSGDTQMFDLLADRIFRYSQDHRQSFLQRSDKTTVLHISVLSQHFDLALQIARRYEHLIGVKDMDGMTALQLLSCNPSAFESGREDAFFEQPVDSVKTCCRLVKWKTVEIKKVRYNSALELAKFLIRSDYKSWETTIDPEIDQSKPKAYGVDSKVPLNEKGEGPSTAGSVSQGGEEGEGESPLFLATKSGCVDIVKEILTMYPQAVEHIDDEGQNILHVAILYRQLQIFKLVRKMGVPMRRQARKVDNRGNSILHTAGMAGVKRKHYYVPEKMQDPSLELQEEMLWFERVKKITPSHLINHQNHAKETAYELLASTNAELHKNAKEWLKHTSEGCSIVAVLIATIAFAAAYTIPGGPNQNTGFPLLLDQPFFVVFIVTDVLSLAFALRAVITFLSILTSPFQIQDFNHYLPGKYSLGITFLILSVSMMMLSFAATIILMTHNKEKWIKIPLYVTAFLPVGLVGQYYFSFYRLSLSITSKCLLKMARKSFLWNSIVVNKNSRNSSSQFPVTCGSLPL